MKWTGSGAQVSESAVSRSLHRLDVVDAGDVVRCRCGGYVGVPPVGAVLLDWLHLGRDTKLTGAVAGLAVFRCDGCKLHYVFGLP